MGVSTSAVSKAKIHPLRRHFQCSAVLSVLIFGRAKHKIAGILPYTEIFNAAHAEISHLKPYCVRFPSAYSNGNITEKKEYAYTTGELGEVLDTKSWSYGDTVWSDLLTDFNGTAITYDEVGNPLTIGSKELSWLGRQLTQITDGEEKISYAYNGDGQRVSKTVNGTTTQFAYLGGRLMAQKTGDDVLFFQYGAGGVPLGFVLNGVQYFYITNQLGDVIGITDSTGKAIVEYTYDEWGSPVQTRSRDNTAEQNKIAEINPLRYRGYYYDTETGYYYLQSRYYNPEWRRFISPDAFGYIDNSTRLGFNAYIYCANNPIMFVDPTGYNYVSPLGEQIGEILSAIFLVIDASQISDAFAALTANLISSGKEVISNWKNWYISLLDDFKEFMDSAFYKFFDFFDKNFFVELFSKPLIEESIPKIGTNFMEVFFTYGSNKIAEILSNLFEGQIQIFSNDNFSTGLIITLDDIGIYIDKVIAKFGSLIIGISAKIQISINDIFNIPPPDPNVIGGASLLYTCIYLLFVSITGLSSVFSPIW